MRSALIALLFSVVGSMSIHAAEVSPSSIQTATRAAGQVQQSTRAIGASSATWAHEPAVGAQPWVVEMAKLPGDEILAACISTDPASCGATPTQESIQRGCTSSSPSFFDTDSATMGSTDGTYCAGKNAPTYTMARHVVYCDPNALSFNQCLGEHADVLVRQDPTKPRATGVYNILVKDASGSVKTTTVLVANGHTLSDKIDGLDFSINATSGDANTAAVNTTFGSSVSAEAFAVGETRQVASLGDRSISLRRLQ